MFTKPGTCQGLPAEDVAQRLGKRLGDGPHGLHALSLGHEGLRQGLGERLGQGRQGQVT